MLHIPWNYQELAFLQVCLLSVNDRVTVTVNTHHQMILPGAFGALPPMMGSFREPANVCRVG
jgi:hypothetical protein